MKVIGKKEELCTGCHECEKACSKAWFKEENIEKSCIKIIEDSSHEGKFEIVVCNQCGECIPICSVNVIERHKNGVVRIEKKDCAGCYACVGFCPSDALFFHRDELEPFKCTSCGICAKVCPTGAIYLMEA
jgi:Fe-S-cluster-containing hydrogenase component 2